MYNLFQTLIIHSQIDINDQIKLDLEKKGYSCEQITRYQDLQQTISQNHYQCIIIEDHFPSLHLDEFIIQMKNKYQSIIIVISQNISSDYLEFLLNIGADDYLITPFQIKDIDIKIQSIYKTGLIKERRIYRFKDIILDASARTCSCHGKPVNLTQNEFKLLYTLISHPYHPFMISDLFEIVWGSKVYEDRTSIAALVDSITRKLENNNPQEKYMKKFGKNAYKLQF